MIDDILCLKRANRLHKGKVNRQRGNQNNTTGLKNAQMMQEAGREERAVESSLFSFSQTIFAITIERYVRKLDNWDKTTPPSNNIG